MDVGAPVGSVCSEAKGSGEQKWGPQRGQRRIMRREGCTMGRQNWEVELNLNSRPILSWKVF